MGDFLVAVALAGFLVGGLPIIIALGCGCIRGLTVSERPVLGVLAL